MHASTPNFARSSTEYRCAADSVTAEEHQYSTEASSARMEGELERWTDTRSDEEKEKFRAEPRGYGHRFPDTRSCQEFDAAEKGYSTRSSNMRNHFFARKGYEQAYFFIEDCHLKWVNDEQQYNDHKQGLPITLTGKVTHGVSSGVSAALASASGKVSSAAEKRPGLGGLMGKAKSLAAAGSEKAGSFIDKANEKADKVCNPCTHPGFVDPRRTLWHRAAFSARAGASAAWSDRRFRASGPA